MRVRTLELRLIGLVLAGCWVVAAAEVLIGYRPGGPADVAVGRGGSRAGRRRARGRDLATRGPRRPRLRGDGLARRRLAAPASSRRSPTSPASSAAAAPRRSCRRSRRPIRGCSRSSGRACSPGSGSPVAGSALRRCAGAGSSGACSSRRSSPRRAGWSSPPSRWATSSPSATGSRRRRGSARRTSTHDPPSCDGAMGIGTSAQLQLHLDGTLDGKAHRVGRPVRRAVRRRRPLARLRRDEPRSRPVRRGDDRRPSRGSARRSPAGAGRRPTRSRTTRSTSTAFKVALSPGGPRGRGVARRRDHRRRSARQCRVAVDGPTFLAAFPQVESSSAPPTSPTGAASSTTGSSRTARSGGSRAASTATRRTSSRARCRRRSRST